MGGTRGVWLRQGKIGQHVWLCENSKVGEVPEAENYFIFQCPIKANKNSGYLLLTNPKLVNAAPNNQAAAGSGTSDGDTASNVP